MAKNNIKKRVTVQRLNEIYTEQEMREQYARMRKVAQKRLKNLAKSEFANSKVYLRNKDAFPYTRDINADEIAEYLYEIRNFISARSSSVRGLQGIRREAIESLRAGNPETGRAPYRFVNKSNFTDFVNFMEWYKDKYASKNYGSPQPEELRSYLDDIKRGMSEEEARAKFEEYQLENANK